MMKKSTIFLFFISMLIGQINGQENVKLNTGICLSQPKTTLKSSSTSNQTVKSVQVKYLNNQVRIEGIVSANCGTEHWVEYEIISGIIYVDTYDYAEDGMYTSCFCDFAFVLSISLDDDNDQVQLNGVNYEIEGHMALGIDDLGEEPVRLSYDAMLDKWYVVNLDSDVSRIMIYGQMGKVLKSYQPEKNEKVALQTESLPKGMYFVSIVSANNKVQTEKIVIK